MIYVVAKLGIADLIKAGPLSSAELAESTGADPAVLFRLLRAVASLGVLTELDRGRFGLTPLGQGLQTGAPGRVRAKAIFNGEHHYRVWGELLHGVQTGEPGHERVFGMDFFRYLAEHGETAGLFNEIMAGSGAGRNDGIVEAYDFLQVGTLVDLGGGRGVILASILQAYPQMHGILFELPPVAEEARGYLVAAGVMDRCEVVEGSFFEAVPNGGDAYILSRVVSDWDDDRCVAIFRNCRAVMARTARLLVVCRILTPGNEPIYGKLMDLHLFMLSGGRERTEPEYRQLLTAAGFQVSNLIPTSRAEIHIIEAMPA